MYLLNKRMSDSNKYIHVCTQSRIKNRKLKERRKKETLLDSNPHLLNARTASYLLGYRGIVFSFSFIKVIVPQSKAHILRRFPKTGRKVIAYSYVSGQCRQTKPTKKHFNKKYITPTEGTITTESTCMHLFVVNLSNVCTSYVI